MQGGGYRVVGRHILGAICLVGVLLWAAGCGDATGRKSALTEQEIQRLTLAQKPNRPDHLIVSGETITWEDVLASLPDDSTATPPLKETLEKAAQEMSSRRFVEEAKPLVYQRLARRIESVVLSKQAQRELGQKVDEKLDDYAEREWRRFVLEEHGGNSAAADDALQKAGMNRVIYKQWRRKKLLADYLVESRYQRDRPITYNELLARYNEMKDKEFVQEAVLQLRLIDIDVAKVVAEHPNEDPAQKAKDLRQRIDAGEDFAELAKRYSHGLRSDEGGLWRPRDPNALAAPYDVLARQAKGMAAGQVAGPIEVPRHFFIMKVEEKRDRTYVPLDLDEVQAKVRRDIVERRFRAVLEELDTEIRQQVDLANTSQFVDYCLDRFYRQVHAMNQG
jgi:parvulin-like peptidyl-prolyl isomerase